MSYVDVLTAQMQARLDNADDALNMLEKYGPDVIRHLVNTNLATIMVPPWGKDKIADLLISKLMSGIKYARKAIVFQRTMVRAFGSPDALRAAAAVINSQVNKAAGDLALDVREENLDGMSPSSWSGDAQYKYSQAFDGQRDAVTRINEFGSALEDALRSMADTIEAYYVELTIVILGIVGAIVGFVLAILEAAGVVTIPVAVLTVIGACLSAAAALAALIAMIVTLSQNNANAIAPLEAELDPWPATAFSI